MTTPDIAGLCERLRAFHAGGYRKEAADTLERQAAEIERLRGTLGEAEAVIRDVDSGARQAAAMNEAGYTVTVERTATHIYGITSAFLAALTGEDTATLGLSGKTQTDDRTRGDA
jgi:hypothetical protein